MIDTRGARYPILLPALIAAFLVAGVTACGGGGPGGSPTTSVDPTPPANIEPAEPALPPPPPAVFARANPSAEDLGESWNDPAMLRTALGLSPVTDPETRIAGLRAIAGSGARADIGSRSVLDPIDVEDIEILGERDGILYRQWKGGPAGTLDIDFDWRFAPNASAETRARMERAGKAWSRRIADEFGEHTAPAGTVIHLGDVEKTLDAPVTTDGVLIFVVDKGPVTDRFSSGGPDEIEYTDDDFQPWLGGILLNREHHGSRGVMAHEIGHVLGIGSVQRYPSVARHHNAEQHRFEGPEATRANGGNPVPYQWLDADRKPVPPGTPGAEVDFGHPGVCSSLMAYCRDRSAVQNPAEIDFAWLDDIGYDILDAETANRPEFHAYGAWATHAAWGVGVERILDGENDRLRAGAHAFGTEPSTGLADNETLSGSAVWTGSLLGVDIQDAALSPVLGNAELAIDLGTLDGAARFDNLATVRDGATLPFRAPSLEYPGSVAGNRFADANGRISASFFGPAHEEMAGVLDDREVGLIAGFGGTR